jgi:hypothetical protein
VADIVVLAGYDLKVDNLAPDLSLKWRPMAADRLGAGGGILNADDQIFTRLRETAGMKPHHEMLNMIKLQRKLSFDHLWPKSKYCFRILDSDNIRFYPLDINMLRGDNRGPADLPLDNESSG